MHTKQLGNLGELKVASDLVNKGYYVFTELGDICKADLLVMDETYQPIKIQVKCKNLNNGTVSIKTEKAGPNYRFRYEEKHADIYAIYIMGIDSIAYISNRELLSINTLTIRINPTKNNQNHGVNWLDKYTDFEKALRDYTRSP